MSHLYMPGDVIHRVEAIESLTEGSIFQQASDARYAWVRHEDGWQGTGYNANTRMARNETMVGHRLVYAASGSELVMLDNYDRYRWSWRDLTRAQALRYGVGINDVDHAIERFHLDNSDGSFPFGTGMRIEDYSVRDTLPEGSTIYVGDPEVYDSFGLYARHQERWERLLGPAPLRDALSRVTVETVGGAYIDQPWLTTPRSEQDEALIARFRAVVWRVALKAKSNHGWCEALENIMSMTNVTEETARMVSPLVEQIGQSVNPAQAAALPVGTVLRSEHGFFVRDDTSSNRARTISLFSRNPSATANYAMAMMVCGLAGVDDLDLGSDVDELWDHLPPGTMFHRRGTTEFYYKAQDGQITYSGRHPVRLRERTAARGEYRRDNFGAWDLMRVTWIPGCPTATEHALDSIEHALEEQEQDA